MKAGETRGEMFEDLKEDIMENHPHSLKEGSGSERRLGSGWCLWEKYQMTTVPNSSNYEEYITPIIRFATLERFAQLWKYTPYCSPASLFYDTTSGCVRRFYSNDNDADDKTIESLLLFREGVDPKWEDPANLRGCSINCDLVIPPSLINSIWQDTVFGLVGENFPYSSEITGVRIVDRLKKHKSIRFELWMSCGSGSPSLSAAQKEENFKKAEDITEFTLKIICKYHQLSIHQFTKKDHYSQMKVIKH